MRPIHIVLIPLFTLILMGCGGTQNKSRVQQLTDAQTEESIHQEQAALNQRVAKMEQSLKDRYALYKEFSGTFEGAITGIQPQYQVKIITDVNQPLYQGERTRTQAEAEEDLKQLGL